MDSIRIYSSVLCVAMIITSFIVLLLPEGNSKSFFKKISSVFMLAVAVLPLSEIEFSSDDFKKYEEDYLEEYSLSADDYFIQSGKATAESEIDAILKDICSGEYSVTADFSKENSTYTLKKVTIVISPEDELKTAVIKQKTGQITGLIPEVTVSDG